MSSILLVYSKLEETDNRSKWKVFCDDMGLDPFLEAFPDKIAVLQVFLHLVHSGELAANGNQIRARSAEDYLRSVAQTFLSLGVDDPRLNSAQAIDFRIQRMLNAWKKEEPPPKRVKPIPRDCGKLHCYVSYAVFYFSVPTLLFLEKTVGKVKWVVRLPLRGDPLYFSDGRTTHFTFHRKHLPIGRDMPSSSCY